MMNNMDQADESYWVMGAHAPYYRQPPPPPPPPQPASSQGMGGSASNSYEYFASLPTAIVHPEMFNMGMDMNSTENHPSSMAPPTPPVQQSLLSQLSEPFRMNYLPFHGLQSQQPEGSTFAMGDWRDTYGMGTMVEDDEMYFGRGGEVRNSPMPEGVNAGMMRGPEMAPDACQSSMMGGFMQSPYLHHQQHQYGMMGPDWGPAGGSSFYGGHLLPDI